MAEWGTIFIPRDADGAPLAPEELPLGTGAGARPAGARRDVDHRARRRESPHLGDRACRSSASTAGTWVRSRSSGKAQGHEAALLGHARLGADTRPGHDALRRQHLVRRGRHRRPAPRRGARRGQRDPPARRRAAGRPRSASTCCSRTCTWTTSSASGSSHRCSGPTWRSTSGGRARRREALGPRLARYLSPPLFPVRVRDLPNLELHELSFEPFEIPGLQVRADLVTHPGPTVGYRLDDGRGDRRLPARPRAGARHAPVPRAPGVDVGLRARRASRCADPRRAVLRARVPRPRRVGAQLDRAGARLRRARAGVDARRVPPRPVARRRRSSTRLYRDAARGRPFDLVPAREGETLDVIRRARLGLRGRVCRRPRAWRAAPSPSRACAPTCSNPAPRRVGGRRGRRLPHPAHGTLRRGPRARPLRGLDPHRRTHPPLNPSEPAAALDIP